MHPISAVRLDRRGLAAIGAGIRAWAAECVCPVGGEPLDVVRVKAMAERMGYHFIGHHPVMPNLRKTAQPFHATRCFENSFHQFMIPSDIQAVQEWPDPVEKRNETEQQAIRRPGRIATYLTIAAILLAVMSSALVLMRRPERSHRRVRIGVDQAAPYSLKFSFKGNSERDEQVPFTRGCGEQDTACPTHGNIDGVTALFLYNFTQFVEWPVEIFDDSSLPLHICPGHRVRLSPANWRRL